MVTIELFLIDDLILDFGAIWASVFLQTIDVFCLIVIKILFPYDNNFLDSISDTKHLFHISIRISHIYKHVYMMDTLLYTTIVFTICILLNSTLSKHRNLYDGHILSIAVINDRTVSCLVWFKKLGLWIMNEQSGQFLFYFTSLSCVCVWNIKCHIDLLILADHLLITQLTIIWWYAQLETGFDP